MLSKFGLWLVHTLLSWLFNRAVKEGTAALETIKEDKHDKEVGEKNVEKYKAATDRAERIKAAQDLLNGTTNP